MQSAVRKPDRNLPPIKDLRSAPGHRRAAFALAGPRVKAPPRNAIGIVASALFPDRPHSFYAAINEALHSRSNREQIRSWRRGHASTPAWALELLELELRKRIDEMQQAIEAIKKERARTSGPEIRY